MAKLFDYIDALTTKKPIKEDPDVFQKDFQPFIINRVFSCDNNLVLIANLCNQGGMTKEMIRDLYYYGVPKGKRFIKYSAKKEKSDGLIKYLMDYFGVNQHTAKQYAVLLDKKEIDEIVEFYEKRGKG